MTACAAFSEESRMRLANAIKVHRKSGEAKPRDLQFLNMYPYLTPAAPGRLTINSWNHW